MGVGVGGWGGPLAFKKQESFDHIHYFISEDVSGSVRLSCLMSSDVG